MPIRARRPRAPSSSRRRPAPRALSINSTATILDRVETQDNPTAQVFDAAGTLDQGDQYDYRVVTTTGYSFGKAQVGLQWRHYPSIKDDDAARNPSTRLLPVVGADPGTATLPADRNLGDTDSGFYDVLGRRLYVGIQMNF